MVGRVREHERLVGWQRERIRGNQVSRVGEYEGKWMEE
jgi:hypothetical protein